VDTPNEGSPGSTVQRTRMGPIYKIKALAGLRNETLGRQQLAKSEAQLRQIIDAIPQMITVLTPAEDPLFANQVMLDYIGLTTEEVMAADFRSRAFHSGDVVWVCMISAEMHCSMSYRFAIEERVLGKDGQYRSFLMQYND
jgi:PAS domain S-box-containing protein